MSNFFHFDRYQCTFSSVGMKDLCRGLSFIAVPEDTYPRTRGYRKAISFGDLAFLMHEPTYGDYGCHLLVGGGDSCGPIVDEVRSVFPGHRVSRADVALDYDYEGAFSDLEATGLTIALDHKPRPLKTHVSGDHYQLMDGRTTYFGSRSSTHFARVYEKGFEQRKKGIDPDASLNWARLEIEIKPTKKGDARLIASTMSPDELAHSSAWTSSFACAVGSSCGDAVRLTTRKNRSALEASLFHMASQYGPLIRRAISSGEVTPDQLKKFFNDCLIHPGNFRGFQ